jgi:serine/threonine protein kinase/HEAT repeat protein
MPDAVIHPTPQELTAFGLGKLPERAAAVVAAHLESCPACRQAVAGVSADSFLNKVRDAKQDKTLLPPNSAQPQNAPSSAGQPVIPVVPCPNVPPELASHTKYLILRELGRGGMGVVYQARQTMMNRQVVIKVVNRSLLDRPDSLERFRREVQAAAQLSHRNIVTAYDAEQAGELHMLVMEFVPGQSLAEVLEKKGPLPVAHACHYMRQVALGLQHAHERGMVHRDIKPQNLMLMPNGQIKILDFGLAKMASERSASKGLTSSDACMGTPEYIAPEQAEDARAADIRADLYSLGCTLYCLLAGRPPFREDTWMKTVLAHLQKTPQPLTELCPDVPERLWRVVARLMAKDRAKRYQKPIEVVQALAPFVKPGAKPDAKGVSVPVAGASSPARGTRIAANTGEIKKILREVPGKTPPKEAPAKEKKASPSAKLMDTGSVSEDIVRVSEAAKPYLSPWWKRPGVLAVAVGVSLALIVMAVIIIKVKVSTPNEHTGTVIGTKGGNNESKPPPAETTVVLEIDQPGAEVFVDEQNIKVNVPGDKEPIKIKVEPGQRKLRISKAGFVAVTQNIELKTGESRSIKIRLVHEPPKPGDKGDEKWIQEVAGLPAEAQVKAVSAKLKELNPGFDGNLRPVIDKGAVVELAFPTDVVVDISPLRALPELQRLHLETWSLKGKLADLTPLQGLPLTYLNLLGCNQVGNLKPLQGMPLTELNLTACDRVRDLTPLQGMKLTHLTLNGCNQVRDLTPLLGMPLTLLDLANCGSLRDLTLLQGKKLTWLRLWGHGQVQDLTLLRGMPLTCLDLFGCGQVRDLTPLQGMKLTLLNLWGCDQVHDLTPLRGMSLESIYFTPKNITKGIEVIRGMKSVKKIGIHFGEKEFSVEEFWKRYDVGEYQTSNQKRDATAPPAADKPRANLPADASVDDLRKALKHADPDVREIAAAGLADLGPKALPALDALAETMNDANNPVSVRSNAALAIANMGAEAKPVVPALAKALQSSQPQQVRMFAAEALHRIKYPANEKGIPAILAAIEKDPDPTVRNQCIEALGGMDRPKFKESGAETLLTKVLNERDKKMEMVRYIAAHKLAQMLRDEAPDRTADVLLEWLTNTLYLIYKGTDLKEEGGRTKPQSNLGGDARFLAAQALAWLGDKAAKRPDVVEALRKAAKDKDEKLKKAAQEAMKELNIKEAEPKKKASPKKNPPNDYDDLAKGSWVDVPRSVEEFNRLKKAKAYAGPEPPKLVDRVLECNNECRLFIPCPKAKNIIVRALVKRSGAKDAGSAVLVLRNANGECVTATFNGDIFRIGKWRDRDQKGWTLASCPSEPYNDYFEFAFAVVGNRLMVYAEGRKKLEAPDKAQDYAPLDRPVVTVVVGTNVKCSADFKRIQIQVLKEAK